MLNFCNVKKFKAPGRFELPISCLLDRRFNQLSHGAEMIEREILAYLKQFTCTKKTVHKRVDSATNIGRSQFWSCKDIICTNKREKMISFSYRKKSDYNFLKVAALSRRVFNFFPSKNEVSISIEK